MKIKKHFTDDGATLKVISDTYKKTIKVKFSTGYNYWCIGQVPCKLKDTGNEVLVKLEGKPEIALDYAEVHYLKLALNELYKNIPGYR